MYQYAENAFYKSTILRIYVHAPMNYILNCSLANIIQLDLAYRKPQDYHVSDLRSKPANLLYCSL